MLKIWFDVSSLDHGAVSGVGTYVRQLTEKLAVLPDVRLVGAWNVFSSARIREIRGQSLIPLEPYVPLLSALNLGQFDVFHGPNMRLPLASSWAQVVTVHSLDFYDDRYVAPREAERRRAILERTMNKIKPEAVIAVSKFTQRQLQERFPQMRDRIRVVHHGADHFLVPVNRGPRPFPFPYFLYVGNLEAKKNVVGLIQAFGALSARPAYREHRLVLVGKPGHAFHEILNEAKQSPMKDQILFPGLISNLNLVNHFQWAEAFVYPSFYEGFGFGLLEAMRLGCPVITTKGSAAEEISGGAALLVAAENSEELTQAMCNVVEDQSLRSQLVARGQARGAEFRWSESARDTLAVYVEAVARKGLKGISTRRP